MLNVGKIWVNGELTTSEECKVSLMTHTLHYGTSVFEGCKAYNGKIFKMTEHNQRLINSGKLCSIEIPYSVEELNKATELVIKENNLQNAYVRPIAWKDDEFLSVNTMKNKTNVAIMAWPWPSYYGEDKIKSGLSLGQTEWVRPDPRSIPVQAKAGGFYYVGAVIFNSMISQGFDDVLMLDWRGFIAECTSANVFFIDNNNELHTPIADAFLNGITRQTIISLARENGFIVHERRMLPQELGNFKEAFATGTAAEVMPIGKIWNTFECKPDVSLKIREMYLKLVNS
jgi:branched-chain amino acid aminotransferase